MNKKIVVLISGNGSNLQAFIEAQKQADFAGQIVAVISNKADAFGLQRAIKASIPAHTIEHTNFASRELFDQQLALQINQYQPDIIILAGFMRILSEPFVRQFHGKLLNIHPSLLPKYPGLHTHRRALENNDLYHGTSVHFVTEELDGGPVIAQAQTKLEANDSEQTLMSRIQSLEHQLYPQTANLIMTGQVKLEQGTLYFEDKPLSKPLKL